MTVLDMMREINFLRELASSLDEIAAKGDHMISSYNAGDLERAGELLRDYADELGRKKVV